MRFLVADARRAQEAVWKGNHEDGANVHPDWRGLVEVSRKSPAVFIICLNRVGLSASKVVGSVEVAGDIRAFWVDEDVEFDVWEAVGRLHGSSFGPPAGGLRRIGSCQRQEE